MSGNPAVPAISWWQEDPARLNSERAALYAVAPDMVWRQEGSGLWTGRVPLWPIPRRQPSGVAALVRGRTFEVTIESRHAHPMVVPFVWPENITPPVIALGWTEWHLLPNGSLCLLQKNSSWDPSWLAAELIPKISGWYIEYHLMRSGYIDSMTDRGIADDDSLDALLEDITDDTEPAEGEDNGEDSGDHEDEEDQDP